MKFPLIRLAQVTLLLLFSRSGLISGLGGPISGVGGPNSGLGGPISGVGGPNSGLGAWPKFMGGWPNLWVVTCIGDNKGCPVYYFEDI